MPPGERNDDMRHILMAAAVSAALAFAAGCGCGSGGAEEPACGNDEVPAREAANEPEKLPAAVTAAPRTPKEVARELARAAARGDAKAQSRLGDMFYVGRGVVRDRAEAVRLYRLAAGQGDAHAAEMLREIAVSSKKAGKGK